VLRIALLLMALLTSASGTSSAETVIPLGIVRIKIGQSGEQFLDTNSLPSKGSVDRQPAGLNFYRARWRTQLPGTVIVDHGPYSFEIPFALTVLGTEDADALGEGLKSFDISAGITAADTIPHDEARRVFLRFIQKLTDLGWKRVHFYDDPRLVGEDAFRYYEEEDTYNIPPEYRPTLEQWMQMDSPYWSLYAEDVFLNIMFRRDSKRMALDKPGAYLVSFSLISKEEQAKSNFQGEQDRANWMDLWEEKIKGLKKQRYAKEDLLRKRGFTIDTDYEDPKIHPADPVEP
jgi:hypothetical protein